MEDTAGCALCFPLAHALTDSGQQDTANRFLRARFDAGSGLLQAWLADGSAFLINASARATGASRTCGTSDQLLRKARTERIQDRLSSIPQVSEDNYVAVPMVQFRGSWFFGHCGWERLCRWGTTR